ncbi:zf-HC2 domain-containing protein [uncultured Tateyamaria sp.]|uniref:zf-HC2 domain-containing protein n=1 Tax=uncultured Tateyamaria sp. TaxID=455651 RepID=UPI00262BE27A|nr:zf-HC2 domain-containing protein [uncultured Tateyamaria sp.]
MTEEYKPTLRRRFAALVHKAPLMIDCPEFEALIDDYIDKNLSWRAALRFDMHLMVCRECRNYLAGYRNAINVAKTLVDVPFSSMGMGEISDGFVAKVIAQQEAEFRNK